MYFPTLRESPCSMANLKLGGQAAGSQFSSKLVLRDCLNSGQSSDNRGIFPTLILCFYIQNNYSQQLTAMFVQYFDHIYLKKQKYNELGGIHFGCFDSENKIIIDIMNINDLLLRPGRNPRRPVAEIANVFDPQFLRPERHRLSEHRGKVNLVKINKHKLPIDFFPKKETLSKRESSQKIYFAQEFSQPIWRQEKAESQRKHYSPEKTSFFGSEEEIASQGIIRINGGNRFLNRKFETREEQKRDLYALEPTRKLNTAAKPHKNDMLELYPSNYDPQLAELLTGSSKTHNLRSPTKKTIALKLRENDFLQDPESTVQHSPTLVLKHGVSQPESKLSNSNNISLQEQSEAMNITFYNAKSSCFPPINRGGGKKL